jgi:chaperonin GroEL
MDGESYLRECLTRAVRESGHPEHILIRGGNAFDHEWETVEGQAWPLGAVSPYFVDQGAVELFNALVMVCRDPLGDEYQWFLPILEEVAKLGRGLLVLASRIRGVTRQLLVVNNLKDTLRVIAADARAEPREAAATQLLDQFRTMVGAGWVASDGNPTASQLGQVHQVLIDARCLFIPTAQGQPVASSRPVTRAMMFHVGGEASEEIKQMIPVGRRLVAELLTQGGGGY